MESKEMKIKSLEKRVEKLEIVQGILAIMLIVVIAVALGVMLF